MKKALFSFVALQTSGFIRNLLSGTGPNSDFQINKKHAFIATPLGNLGLGVRRNPLSPNEVQIVNSIFCWNANISESAQSRISNTYTDHTNLHSIPFYPAVSPTSGSSGSAYISNGIASRRPPGRRKTETEGIWRFRIDVSRDRSSNSCQNCYARR